MPLFQKIETIATRIYRADEVIADSRVRDQLHAWEEAGYGHLPICMAKTQYTFTTDPDRRGAPDGHSVPVREVRLSAGAGFVVAICGDIMTMPGLPREPAAAEHPPRRRGADRGAVLSIPMVPRASRSNAQQGRARLGRPGASAFGLTANGDVPETSSAHDLDEVAGTMKRGARVSHRAGSHGP